jgi:hypothetical protein
VAMRYKGASSWIGRTQQSRSVYGRTSVRYVVLCSRKLSDEPISQPNIQSTHCFRINSQWKVTVTKWLRFFRWFVYWKRRRFPLLHFVHVLLVPFSSETSVFSSVMS